MDIISNISTALEIVKKLRGLDRKISENDFLMHLADLTSELGDAKLSAAHLRIELAEAKERIRELEREVAQRGSPEPELHEAAYVFGDLSRHYCTGCYDTRGKKILLNELTGVWSDFGKWQCPSCDKTFGPTTL